MTNLAANAVAAWDEEAQELRFYRGDELIGVFTGGPTIDHAILHAKRATARLLLFASVKLREAQLEYNRQLEVYAEADRLSMIRRSEGKVGDDGR